MPDGTDISKKQIPLSDICVYDAKLFGDEFVGLKYENEKLSVYFPLGYSKSESDKEKRKDILNLISVLAAFSDNTQSFYPVSAASTQKQKAFPIQAYIQIISDFLNHGYYTESDSVFKRGTSGKISWSRTIKKVRPQIQDDGIMYLEFITRHTSHNEAQLITLIHQFCVYESFSKIGYIFTNFMPPKPATAFNAKLFSSVIKSKFANTFNEKNQVLFKNMLDIIEYLDSNSEAKTFYYGTENFETVWERLVNEIYGEKDKEKFLPHSHWHIYSIDKKIKDAGYTQEKSALIPDTVMITNRKLPNQKTFVLDAKYYKYGVTKDFSHLPNSSSIVKQIAYAEYIAEMENCGKLAKSENIYNAFIMPGNVTGNNKIENIGYATGDWTKSKEALAPYYKIQGIVLDVKSVMQKHAHSTKAILEMAECIEKGVRV